MTLRRGAALGGAAARRSASQRASLVAYCALVAALVLGACNDTPAAAGSRPIVVATTGQIFDVARRLAGEDFEVRCLLGPGSDPHTHQPTRRDIQDLYEADLVLTNGLHLEVQMQYSFDALSRAGRRVAVVTDVVDRAALLRVDEGTRSTFDPHVWMDPLLWDEVAQGIRGELVSLLPSVRARIDERLDEFGRDVRTIDAYIATAIDTVPPSQRLLITAHDAFGYFARRYGIEVAAIQGISTESEAGVRHIQDLVDLVVLRRVPALFVEESVSARGLESLLESAQRRGLDVALGGTLFSDSLGPPDTFRGTWVGMLDHNATTIVRALGGNAPRAGAFGRLDGGAQQ